MTAYEKDLVKAETLVAGAKESLDKAYRILYGYGREPHNEVASRCFSDLERPMEKLCEEFATLVAKAIKPNKEAKHVDNKTWCRSDDGESDALG